MCGIVGYLDGGLRHRFEDDLEILGRMADTIVHRGPDSSGFFVEAGIGLGFRRLSIIDLESGDQPLYSEDRSVVLLCNGEIYNHRELRQQLQQRGHAFSTSSDVEVLLHLYEEEGPALVHRVNGQFAFVLYDRNKKSLFLARDHFGINPMFFTVVDGLFLFASEIKALLRHPLVRPAIDLTGLDQILSLPGTVSPRTMFKGIQSVAGGHYLLVQGGDVQVTEYWDLDYPLASEITGDLAEADCVERLEELFAQSVRRRLQADVPVGIYLSGGMDSSMVAAMARRISPQVRRHSFSISFADEEISEARYQRLMADFVASEHHEIRFEWQEIALRLSTMVLHCESAVKETFNTCALALSEAARREAVKVILAGQGADELFAGYPGYRYDQFRGKPWRGNHSSLFEEEIRERLWGDPVLFYETDFHALKEIKSELYSEDLRDQLEEFECTNFGLVNHDRLVGRHPLHQRSYLDFKLRLTDHLLSDHGDRMALANSVEARYPFLDIDLVEFSRGIPPSLKLKGFTEKYILKKLAKGLIPGEIVDREKFGFRAPGSPYLLQQKNEWIGDLLSYERVKRQGIFIADVVESLKGQYSQLGFKLNPHLETDYLLIVLTLGIFMDLFAVPGLN
jgi:asparagine synthase (glutamine-hydrolysing)